MKLKRILFIIPVFIFSGILSSQEKKVNLSLDPQKSQWFKEARFGIFIHWGLYSMLEGKYEGTILTPAVDKEKFPNGQTWYAEWIQMRLDIPNDVYQSLSGSFNPVDFDAEAWIREVKNAGAKYFVITSKHHDGFALWNTKVSDFKVTNTPFKRDILAELVAACKKYGIKYGFYYSHWQDWEHPQGALPEWKKQRTDAEFDKYWHGKCIPQVVELIDNFDPDLLWFDTWGTEGAHITTARRDELIAVVRSHSDKCLINGRISFSNPGNNIDFLEMMDNEYPDAIIDKPWQTPATMVHSWGWHAFDYNWKSSARMVEYLVNNASKGGNYLLNIGPKPDGVFPNAAIRRLQEIGAWNVSNGEAVYGTRPVNVSVDEGIYLTQKKTGNQNYLYISIAKPLANVYVPIESSLISDSRVLETNMPIEYKAVNNVTNFIIPPSLYKDASVQVIKVAVSKDF